MIPQARITSETEAVVHLGHRDVPLVSTTLPELRSMVKDVFIEEARREGGAVDVLITEPDRSHHLRVEPNGRIKSRPQDDRPVHGPHTHLSEVGADAAAESVAPAASSDDSAPPVLAPSSDERPATAAMPSPDPASGASAPSAGPRLGEPHSYSAPSASTAHTAATATSASSAAAPPSPARPVGAPVRSDGRALPTLDDLRSGAKPAKPAPAERGWRGALVRMTGGRIAPKPGRKERREREQVQRIRRTLDAPKNIVVVNLKGGAHKTTACLMIASTLGTARAGGVLAWDNNETRGTLGWRGEQDTTHRTAVDLLRDLDRLEAQGGATAAELDGYVRHQSDARFDILASDEDAGSAASVDGRAFARLDSALARHYRVKVIDTGNNVRASNWLAAVESADQLVIISTVREDTFNAAAWMIDELRATGYADKVDNAVTILSHSSPQGIDKVLHKRLLAHFGAHTRAVHEVPFERQFVDGAELDWARVSADTKKAWVSATATIVDGL